VKLLLDSCVWGGALTRLRAAGHDVVWSGEWPADPGDEEILARALAEGRVLVTLDKDADVTLHVLQLHGADLATGAIVTAEAGCLRVRLPTGA